MMKQYAVGFLTLMAGLAPMVGRGQVGEPAPPLMIKEWIQGPPVEVKSGTNLYVIQIFTTTSLTNQQSLTNLNALQTRFKGQGVLVVGVSDEPVEKIREFMAHDGKVIKHAIAADDRRKTALSYMRAIRQRGVPHVFVVGKDGQMLWHGHPQDGVEEVLEQVVAGRYDPAPAARLDVAHIQIDQYLTLARQNDKRVPAAGRQFLILWTNDVASLCDLTLAISADRAPRKRDLELAAEALVRAEELVATNSARVAEAQASYLFATGKKAEGLARAKEAVAFAQGPREKARAEAFVHHLETRRADDVRKQVDQYLLLARRNDPEAAAAGRRLLGGLTNDVAPLCHLAVQIASDPRITRRDLPLANDALNQAEKLAPTNSTRLAVSRAIVLFETGKEQDGLARAREALATAQGEKDKALAEKCLRTMTAAFESARTNQAKTNLPPSK